MKSLYFLFFAITSIEVLGQIELLDLPDSVLKNTNEIILNDVTDFVIEDPRLSYLTRSYTVVILNSKASRNEVQIDYHAFSKILLLNVEVYNSRYEKVTDYRLKDFNDLLISDDLSSSHRSKYLKAKHSDYPYYIKVKVKKELLSSLHYPVWYPQNAEHQTVVNTKFTVRSKVKDQFRFKGYNIDEPSRTIKGVEEIVSWEAKNLPPFEKEFLSGGIRDYAPIVYLAPNTFEVDGLVGNMNSWQSLGQWMNALNHDRNDLEISAVEDLVDQAQNLSSEEEKIRLVYNFLQKNTRYVSIQLGIGGWRAFKASYVHDQKYGDCKALSFYTKSLLEKVGVPSYYTLINSGNNPPGITMYDFPNAYFNHAILTVPVKNDTIWLECTSQTNPFGYLGTFTSDRKALMISEKGGDIIRTKKYDKKENQQTTLSHLTIRENGDVELSLDKTLTGLEIENDGFVFQLDKSHQEQREWIYDYLKIGDIKSLEFNFLKLKDEIIPSSGYHIKAIVDGLVTHTGKRLFLSPPNFSQWSKLSLTKGERKTPIKIRYPSIEIDTFFIKSPNKYRLESGYKNVLLSTKYGSFQIKTSHDGEVYQVIRKVEIEKGIYPPDEYAEFREFIMRIRKSSRKKLVFTLET